MSRADKETIIKKQPIVYSDFVSNLLTHPISGDIARVTNEESIKQSIKNLLMINYGEKLFNPIIGSDVFKSLFEPLDGFTLNTIHDNIVDTIKFHETRVELINVTVSGIENDENSIAVAVFFNIINTGMSTSINLILGRVR
jgi:phage baseplate assembly protein W